MLWLPELKASEISNLPQSFNSQKSYEIVLFSNLFCMNVLLKRCYMKLTSEPCRNGSIATNWMAPSIRVCKILHANAKQNGYYPPLLHKNKASSDSIHPTLSLHVSQKILIKFYFKRWYPCLLGSWLQSPSRMHVPGYLMDPLVPDSQEAVPWTSCNCHAILCHTKTAYPVVVTC